MTKNLCTCLLLAHCRSDQFLWKTNISQGSVATCFGCGGTFNDRFIANLLLNAAVKKFWESVIIQQIYVRVFFDSHCKHTFNKPHTDGDKCYKSIAVSKKADQLLTACLHWRGHSPVGGRRAPAPHTTPWSSPPQLVRENRLFSWTTDLPTSPFVCLSLSLNLPLTLFSPPFIYLSTDMSSDIATMSCS